jgi:chromosome segregation ATPase
MAEFEFGGMTFRGGKMMIILTALSTAGGAMWGGFEVYKDYMDMRERITEYEAPDLSGFQEQLSVINEKMDGVLSEVTIMKQSMNETADRVSDIKNDLRDDLVRMEKIIDQVEDDVKEVETDVRGMIQNAEERFENKRDALQNDYDEAKDRLQTNTERELTDLEDRLNKRLQRALDNPLAN